MLEATYNPTNMGLMFGKYNPPFNFDVSMKLPVINLLDYLYDLPEDRIALYPLPDRDKAKLLVYDHGEMSHKSFFQLPDLLPDNTILFFNDTKVIPARFLFNKATGASIEVLLLQPVLPSTLLSFALTAIGGSTWKCTIGNLKRWSNGLVLRKEIDGITLFAHLTDGQNGLVEFSWTPAHLSFAEILHVAGLVPLPPYIRRKAEVSDKERYQTVYSHLEGAVAAPTAGLHFTESVLEKMRAKGIVTNFLTLHVSAGTFLPVKAANAVDHSMHSEQIIIPKSAIRSLLLEEKKIIAVGTTAMRTLESLYWYAVKLLDEPAASFIIDQHVPYKSARKLSSPKEAAEIILATMEKQGLTELVGQTSIYIFPGYRFRICEGLVTNFHQPGSTLILLIAAFIGLDWKKIYQEALDKEYRFLSYGDSSLLLPR